MKNKQKERCRSASAQLSKQVYNNDLASQRQSILDWLRQKSLTTLEARKELDVMAPAARIFELRHFFGFNIITNWLIKETKPGHKHRIGEYVLLPGKFQEE